MKLTDPVSTIMTSKLFTVNPEDELSKVQEIFDQHNIHHIPVVRYKEIVGIISKSDYLFFMRGFTNNAEDRFINDARMKAYHAQEIMTKGLAKLETYDSIASAVEVFKLNRFHCIPVLENGDLVGIVTTHDIIKHLSEQATTA